MEHRTVERFGPDQETLDRVADQASLDGAYLAFMAAAGVLAAVGLLSNSIPILVGAMVVAPALAPLALIAFALAADDFRLAAKGAGTAFAGLAVAFAFAVATTIILNVTNVIPPEANLLDKPLLEERVRPGWYAVVAAVAAGVVGAIALDRGKVDTLVGTVAALALVPAAAAGGIGFLSSDPVRGLGGLLLLAINVVFIVAMALLVLVVTDLAGRRGSGVPRRGLGLLLLALGLIAAAVVVLAVVLMNGYAVDDPPML